MCILITLKISLSIKHKNPPKCDQNIACIGKTVIQPIVVL